MKTSKTDSKKYTWGNNCLAWNLVNTPELSIKEELMPPNTEEQLHFHQYSEQFFRILKGMAQVQLEEEIIEVEEGHGVYIPPKAKHRIYNRSKEKSGIFACF